MPSGDTSCLSSPVWLWVEEDDAFCQASLFHESSSSQIPFPSSSSVNVSVEDIFFQTLLTKDTATVLFSGSSGCVEIPVGKIHMCYNTISAASRSEKRSRTSPGYAHTLPLDLLAGPTNLPSVLDQLRAQCAGKGVGELGLVKVGPVYLALRVCGDWASELVTDNTEQEQEQEEPLSPLQSVAAEALQTVESGKCASLVISGCSGSGR